jgi:cytochrome c biogenesis protein CcmG, thiol:disulfide interchange protein DsbE
VKHPARWIAASVAVVLVVLGVILALNVGNDPEADSQSSPLLDKLAPAFDLPTLDGTRVTDADLQGKYTLVNFWNTWCGPCIDELPALQEFHEAHKDDTDVQMVGIVRDPNESKSVITSYAKANGMDWTLAMDPGNKAALDFATRGQPESFLVDPNGVVRVFFYGPVTAASLNRALAAIGRPA